MTAVIFICSYIFWPQAFHGVGLFEFVLWLGFLTGLVALAIYDIYYRLLPNKIVYPLIAVALVQSLVVSTFFCGGWASLRSAVIVTSISAGIFYLLFQVSKGSWIGGGDVKLGIL